MGVHGPAQLIDHAGNRCPEIAIHALAELGPVYREAARLLQTKGAFMLVGYHPFFLLNGMLTHFHGPDGSATAIESHVHLFADHFRAARQADLALVELDECLIDEAWLATKPKWRRYLGWPASFAMVYRKG